MLVPINSWNTSALNEQLKMKQLYYCNLNWAADGGKRT